jgi:Holliday junction resolvase RusA-like endonuclease
MSDEPNTFIIPGELYSSKNSRLPLIYKDPSGKTIKKVIKSPRARDHERHLMQLFENNPAFCASFRTEAEGCGLPLKLHIKIYRRTRQRFDYTNICQNLFDCMVKSNLLSDDSADLLLPVFEPYEVDNETPRVEMKLLP